ncbi:hypothetical protein AVEN_213750-1 [Araneus ventricosus]|uniref:Uncharacterized protein n=1 Tax=Araneus ventricosus TaxID=182803 RepID=A0A4Y2H4G6_ARAVE|nr:hypothetical protein AVEN_3643-1 [Araneus ventricosus]GBM60533.1 hypothetical protein AVEN_213750-1 [Araneus ventricosus]
MVLQLVEGCVTSDKTLSEVSAYKASMCCPPFGNAVVSNLTENMAYNNTGMHILDVQGFERMPLSYQTCERNWFWRNTATDRWDKSTIIAGKAGQRFNYNYLLNPENDFELAAKNRT